METLQTKLTEHQDRATQMGECIPPWLWLADDGTHEGYIFWAELFDGLKTLCDYCAIETDRFVR